MLTEWDDDTALLASHARFCDHDYQSGFCVKCGWKRGSHKSLESGAGPGDGAPVPPPLPDDVYDTGPAPQDQDSEEDLEEDLELFEQTGKEEPR